MYSFRKWLYKPRRDDTSHLAQFYYADETLNRIAAELDSFDGRKDPEKCTSLVNQLRQTQDKILNIWGDMMDELLPKERAPRDFRHKFPDDVLQENLSGQLWFGAECLAAGNSILNREMESNMMRPLAKAVTKTIESVRNLMREQCLMALPEYTDAIRESLRLFDHFFAEFELNYVSAMVPVKSVDEYDMQQNVVVLFSETLQRALTMKLVCQDDIENYDPVLMFTIPRLAIVSGLFVFPEGPLNLDQDSRNLSELFRPFKTLLHKIRELLWTMTSDELLALEKCLCSMEEEPDINIEGIKDSSTVSSTVYGLLAYNSEFVKRFYANYPSCKQVAPELTSLCPGKKQEKNERKRDRHASKSSRTRERQSDRFLWRLTGEERSRTRRRVRRDSRYRDRHHAETLPSYRFGAVFSEYANRRREHNSNRYDNHPIRYAACPVHARGYDISSPDEMCLCVHSRSTEMNYAPQNSQRYEECPIADHTYVVHMGPFSNATAQSVDSNSSQLEADANDNLCPNDGGETPCQRILTASIENCVNHALAADPSLLSLDSIYNRDQFYAPSSDHLPMQFSQMAIEESPNLGHNMITQLPESPRDFYPKEGSPASKNVTVGLSDGEGDSSGSTSPHHSGTEDDEEVALALQAAEVAASLKVRERFPDSKDLIHRLFVCISGVADQLQTNFASDLRKILKSVFLMNQLIIPDAEEDECLEQIGSEEFSRYSNSEHLSVESAEEALIMADTPESERDPSSDEMADLEEDLSTGEAPTGYCEISESQSEMHTASSDEMLVACHQSTSGNRIFVEYSDLKDSKEDIDDSPEMADTNAALEDSASTLAADRRRSVVQEPPPWVLDHMVSRCMACGTSFTVIRRRHHCRNCGKIFCGHCSSHYVPLPHYGIWKNVRVCNPCFLHYVTTSAGSSDWANAP